MNQLRYFTCHQSLSAWDKNNVIQKIIFYIYIMLRKLLLHVTFMSVACILSPLYTQVPVDIEVIDAGPLSYVTPGTYAVIPTVINNDIDYSISDLNANWQLDGGDIHSCLIGDFMLGYADLYPTFKSRIVVEDSVTFTTTGIHTLKIWTDTPGGYPDTNPSNDTSWLTVHVCDSLPEKNVLIWYGTHIDCFPCGGYGENMIDSIDSFYPDNTFMIRVHDEDGDPFVCDESTDINNIYIWPFSGHPSFVFDQFEFPYFHDMVPFELYSIQWIGAEWRMDYRSPVAVTVSDVEIDSISKILTAEIHATFYADYEGPLTMNAILIEDSLYGYQAGYPGSYMYHTQVMRSMSNGVEGAGGIIPVSASAGETYTLTISEALDTAWDQSQLYLVGDVAIDAADPLQRNILNSTRVKIDELKEDSDTTQTALHEIKPESQLLIHPNPADHEITINMDLNAFNAYDPELQLLIYAADGRLVSGESAQFSVSNEQLSYHFNASDLPDGIYLAEILSTQSVIANAKFIIAHQR